MGGDAMMSGDMPHEWPMTLDVNNRWDERRSIRYLGIATRQPDGKWICLADVCGTLALVEVNITFGSIT